MLSQLISNMDPTYGNHLRMADEKTRIDATLIATDICVAPGGINFFFCYTSVCAMFEDK